MNPVVIIPTYISSSRRRSEASSVTNSYDHTTDINNAGELERCLASLQCVQDLGVVMILVAADRSIEAEAEAKVRETTKRYPELETLIIGEPELELIRQSIAQLGLETTVNKEISLRGYSAIKNVGILVANVLGFDAVVFVDDDEVIDDSEFLHKAMYGLGKLTRKGIPIFAKTGFYLNEQGSYLSSWENKWYNRLWQKGSAFNEWITRAMQGSRLSRSNHVCGGCLAIHKEAFKRIAFDPWIARGEDLDYMLSLRMYGSDIWFDNKWYLHHLPPESNSEGNRFSQDIYRWAYEHDKLEFSHSLIDLQKITPKSLEPYPGPFLEKGLRRRIRLTAFLRSLVRPDKRAYRKAAKDAVGAATTYAQENCTNYFEFQRVWPQITEQLESSAELSKAIISSSFKMAAPSEPSEPSDPSAPGEPGEPNVPSAHNINPGLTSEIRLNIAE